jgi:hypothetical protein
MEHSILFIHGGLRQYDPHFSKGSTGARDGKQTMAIEVGCGKCGKMR